MKKPLLTLLCLTLLLFSSCVDSSKIIEKENLVGLWIFESGTRNGSIEGVDLLEKLVFNFSDKTLKCELLPEMKEGFGKEMSYELRENTIIVGEKLNIPIKGLGQDSLLIQLDLVLGDEPTLFDLKFVRQ